ncbi:MAG: methyltransferase domain-containing protein [Nitrospinae bacterium]|nr:methyltransferase domain-containing protein [Nitrospinota bacterium]
MFLNTLIAIRATENEKLFSCILIGLPREIINSKTFHILLIDDTFNDNIYKTACSWTNKNGVKNITILKLHQKQGYGDALKICFNFSLENNFDMVSVVTADEKSDPGIVVDLSKKIQESNMDVLCVNFFNNHERKINSHNRIFALFKALFPSWANRIFNVYVPIFFSDYRFYSTKFLKTIPFEMNSHNYYFDFEIILQALHSSAMIDSVPVPIPCNKKMVSYSFKDCFYFFKLLIQFKFQQWGLFVSLKYPYSAKKIYKDKTGFRHSTHFIVTEYLSNKFFNEFSILDIGCGSGAMAKSLKSHQGKITGIDLFEPEENPFFEFRKMDLANDLWDEDISKYDVVLMLDILEHLPKPEEFLLEVRKRMKSMAVPDVIISVPNIGFLIVRLNLLFGIFNYADRGILDISHKRFFTLKSMKRLLKETGYEIHKIQGVGIPFQLFGENWFFRGFSKLSSFFAQILPSIFAFQFLFYAKPKLNYHQIIRYSKHNTKTFLKY